MSILSLNVDRDEAIALRRAISWTLATCCGTNPGQVDFCESCEILQAVARDIERIIARSAAAAVPPRLTRAARARTSRGDDGTRERRPVVRDHLVLLPPVAHD